MILLRTQADPHRMITHKKFSKTEDYLSNLKQDFIRRWQMDGIDDYLFIGCQTFENIQYHIDRGRYRLITISNVSPKRAFVLVTSMQFPELWVHRSLDAEDYAAIYRKFVAEVVGVDDFDDVRHNYDLDHVFARSMANSYGNVDFMMLLPIPKHINRSYGTIERARSLEIRKGKDIYLADFISFHKMMHMNAPSISAQKFGRSASALVDQHVLHGTIEQEEVASATRAADWLVSRIRRAYMNRKR